MITQLLNHYLNHGNRSTSIKNTLTVQEMRSYPKKITLRVCSSGLNAPCHYLLMGQGSPSIEWPVRQIRLTAVYLFPCELSSQVPLCKVNVFIQKAKFNKSYTVFTKSKFTFRRTSPTVWLLWDNYQFHPRFVFNVI